MSPVVSGSPWRPLLLVLLSSLSVVCVTGCGLGTAAAPNPLPLTVNGRVHGGQQAVVGAQIQLYVAGKAGNGSASSALLNTTVTSGQDGGFSITGDYSCPSSTAQVYLVATGGNPGLGPGGNNPALAMMAPLGSCGNLTPTQYIWINEVTTVAAAYTLAPFDADIAHIGSSATNYNGAVINEVSTQSGLANAFLNAGLIVDTSTGNVPAALPSNLTTETGKIYALADAVAACINSDGSAGSPCNALFTAATPSGGTAPTNTWDALIDIVKNPGNNVAGVYAAIGPTPPFATTLSAAPNDWTLSLTVTGGGVSDPTSLGIDSQGNVWVADYNGAVSVFNPQGTPLSASGFGTSVLSEDFGLAIDPGDNVWVTVEESPFHGSGTRGSVVRFSGVSAGGTLGTATVFSDNTINYPYGVTADSSGNIFVANNSIYGGSGPSVVLINPTANTYTGEATNGEVSGPTALAPDAAHGVWVDSGSGGTNSLAHFDVNGNLLAAVGCCGPSSAVAVDTSGAVWMADSLDSSDDESSDTDTGSVALVGADGSVLQDFITSGGILYPSGLVLDAAGTVWISNLHTTSSQDPYETISELAGVSSGSPGTPLSPSTGLGLDAHLLLPYGLAIDPGGNVWVSNHGGNDLVMFFGLAAPTKTPTPVTPQAP